MNLNMNNSFFNIFFFKYRTLILFLFFTCKSTCTNDGIFSQVFTTFVTLWTAIPPEPNVEFPWNKKLFKDWNLYHILVVLSHFLAFGALPILSPLAPLCTRNSSANHIKIILIYIYFLHFPQLSFFPFHSFSFPTLFCFCHSFSRLGWSYEKFNFKPNCQL